MLEAEQPVDFGGGCGHEGFDEEGLEPDEVEDDVEDYFCSAYKGAYLPDLRCCSSQN